MHLSFYEFLSNYLALDGGTLWFFLLLRNDLQSSPIRQIPWKCTKSSMFVLLLMVFAIRKWLFEDIYGSIMFFLYSHTKKSQSHFIWLFCVISFSELDLFFQTITIFTQLVQLFYLTMYSFKFIYGQQTFWGIYWWYFLLLSTRIQLQSGFLDKGFLYEQH